MSKFFLKQQKLKKINESLDLLTTCCEAHETPITPQYTLENCPQHPSSRLSHIAAPPTSFLKQCQQNYSEANKDINGCSWQLAPALCIHYVSLPPPPHPPNTQKTAIKPLLCVYDGLRCAATPAFGARGFHGWDSQRSVMNIHVWSAAGKIPGEIERAGKMNIELTCWAGRGLHSQLPSHNVLCC